MEDRRQPIGCAAAFGFVIVPIAAAMTYHRMTIEVSEAGTGRGMVSAVHVALLALLPVAVVAGAIRGHWPLNNQRVKAPTSLGVTCGLLGALSASLFAPSAKAAIYGAGCVLAAVFGGFAYATLISRAIHRLGGWGKTEWPTTGPPKET